MVEDSMSTGRFRSTVLHYLAGRPPYAGLLIQRVAAMAELGPNDRVLDLGCGPGQLARAFAPLAGEVVAMDPEPGWMRSASSAAGRRTCQPGWGGFGWR